MESLIIKATKATPAVCFDSKNNILEIKGKSYPANSEEFFSPLFSWLDPYLNQLGTQKVALNMDLIYFNSSSSVVFMELFSKLETAVINGKEITVNWIYEEDDEDILEYGEEFQEDFEKLPFNFVEKELEVEED